MKRVSEELAQDYLTVYEIKVQGWIDESWSDWFEGMTIVAETSTDGIPITRLIGTVVDQAALLGLLRRLHNLHLQLLSVNRVE
jgi:hypothetical protein